MPKDSAAVSVHAGDRNRSTDALSLWDLGTLMFVFYFNPVKKPNFYSQNSDDIYLEETYSS